MKSKEKCLRAPGQCVVSEVPLLMARNHHLVLVRADVACACAKRFSSAMSLDDTNVYASSVGWSARTAGKPATAMECELPGSCKHRIQRKRPLAPGQVNFHPGSVGCGDCNKVAAPQRLTMLHSIPEVLQCSTSFESHHRSQVRVS